MPSTKLTVGLIQRQVIGLHLPTIGLIRFRIGLQGGNFSDDNAFDDFIVPVIVGLYCGLPHDHVCLDLPESFLPFNINLILLAYHVLIMVTLNIQNVAGALSKVANVRVYTHKSVSRN